MVNILGIDPGKTTGWCIYDATRKEAIACGEFAEWDVDAINDPWAGITSRVVVERPKGYGPTRPQLVDCGYVCGRIVERLRFRFTAPKVHELTRHDVCKTLTEATHGVVNVRNDATAWAALLLLHGGDAAGEKPRTKKGVEVSPGGALGRVTGHGRAALAVAVAWSLKAIEPHVAAGVAP